MSNIVPDIIQKNSKENKGPPRNFKTLTDAEVNRRRFIRNKLLAQDELSPDEIALWIELNIKEWAEKLKDTSGRRTIDNPERIAYHTIKRKKKREALQEKVNATSKKKFRESDIDEKRKILRSQAKVRKRERADPGNTRNKNITDSKGPAVRDIYKNNYSSNINFKNVDIEDEEHIPDLVDTRKWSWEKWIKYFMGKILLDYQVEDHASFDKDFTILNNPRQHGKTTYVAEPRLLRRCCESVFDTIDKTLGYITHSNKLAKRMVMSIRIYLMTNQKIIKNYGNLVDLRHEKSVKLQSNTQYELRLTTLKDPQLVSLQGLSIESNIRGSNIYELLIDDPIDILKEKKRDNVQRATEDFMIWLKYKILPLVKGSINCIGTRYDPQDVWYELDQMQIFRWIKRKAINGTIPSYTIPERKEDRQGNLIPIKPYDLIVDVDIRSQLLAPSLWDFQLKNKLRSGNATQNILFKHFTMGEPAFQQELMNNPLPLESVLKWEWLTSYTVLPEIAYKEPLKLNWIVSGDPASGKTKAADHTAFVLLAEYRNNYYIHDMIFGHWTGLQKKIKLEEFVVKAAQDLNINNHDIIVILERFGNNDFFNRMNDESWITPKSIDPGKQGEKIRRITYNLGQEMENGKVFIFDRCRNRNQLETEVIGFPVYHPDLLDAANQAIYFYKNEYVSGAGIVMTI